MNGIGYLAMSGRQTASPLLKVKSENSDISFETRLGIPELVMPNVFLLKLDQLRLNLLEIREQPRGKPFTIYLLPKKER